MAITRRQFVTRLGALAAAAGFSQVEASKIMEAVAYNPATAPGSVYQGTFGKPRVVWLHGAECTGCSTSLLGFYENPAGVAVTQYLSNGNGDVTTADALIDAGTLPITNGIATGNNFTLASANLTPDPGAADIADLVIDIIDLLYHETVQGPGGDLAFQWLKDFNATNTKPFVLVVEGALQKSSNGGAWNDTSNTAVPWCSIAKNDAGTEDIVTAEIVQTLGESAFCAAVVAIGQCATFGGYPACKPPISTADAGFNTGRSQTDAMGTFDYLTAQGSSAAGKVINAPGCPTNPWWFILSVVAFLVDVPSVFGKPVGTVGTLGVLKTVATSTVARPGLPLGGNGTGIGINAAAVDGTRRLKAVYTSTVHGPKCSKYRYYTQGIFASHPGGHGCLQKIGCKGPAAHSLCTVHGWNNQQPENVGIADTTAAHAVTMANPAPTGGAPYEGGNCTRAGHPCMACTEKGYPDSFVPFVVRS